MRKTLLEFKARIRERRRQEQVLAVLGADLREKFRQVDTYLTSKHGRLKIRETPPKRAGQLIFYEREDVIGPKLSRIVVIRVADAPSLRRLFKAVFGVKTIVDKVRMVFDLAGAEVHLDEVKGLGDFLEVEMPATSHRRKDEHKLEGLMKKLGVSRSDLILGSYSDLTTTPMIGMKRSGR